MPKKGQISVFQLFSILFLGRAAALFTFMQPEAADIPASDRAFSALPLVLFELLYLLIFFIAEKRCRNEGIISAVKRNSEKTAQLFSLIYALCLIWFAGLEISRSELFMSSVLFPDSILLLPAFFLIAAALAGAFRGIEAIGRASVIFFIMLVLSICFIIFSVWGDFEFINLKPLCYAGAGRNIKYALYMSMRFSEIPTLFIIMPHISGNIRKMSVLLSLSYGALSALVLTVLCGVAGEYGDMQMFQFYTLTVIAETVFLERMDDILISMWVLSAVIKAAYLIFTASDALCTGFIRLKRKTALIFTALCVSGVYLFSSDSVLKFIRLSCSAFHSAVFLVLTAVLPLVFIITDSVRRRKNL